MRYLVLGLMLLFLTFCTSSHQVIEESTALVGSNGYDESFDPHSLNDDDIVIAKPDPVVPVEMKTEVTDTKQNVVIIESSGYRVQLIATKSIETASQTELEARDIFVPLNHKVYLIFDAPNYKVRVGDIVNRDEADGIRDIAKDYGYRGAFVVRSKVNVPSQQ